MPKVGIQGPGMISVNPNFLVGLLLDQSIKIV